MKGDFSLICDFVKSSCAYQCIGNNNDNNKQVLAFISNAEGIYSSFWNKHKFENKSY